MKQFILFLLGLLISTTSQAETYDGVNRRAMLIDQITQDGEHIITIEPGDDVATIVERAPAGTTFHLHPGLYRMQYARPKSGQKFIAKGEVVFNGATILSGWRNVDGFWVARGPEKRQAPSGHCHARTPLCGHNEDLFVNGKVYLRATSLAQRTTFACSAQP